MSTFESFEDILAWQKARVLHQHVIQICRRTTLRHDRVMSEQLRGAALSVMGNIAEGFDRGSRSEFIYFLSVAKGSAAEVRSYLYAALDAEHISATTFEKVRSVNLECGRLIGGLMTYLRGYEEKGVRYKNDLDDRDPRLSVTTKNSKLQTPNSKRKRRSVEPEDGTE